MSLDVSKVPRALEKKTRLFGFELGDVLLVFLYLSLTNFLFGQTQLKFPVVWCGTIALACVLYFVKRGKPDNFLQHWGEYQFSEDLYSAGTSDTEFEIYKGRKSLRKERNAKS